MTAARCECPHDCENIAVFVVERRPPVTTGRRYGDVDPRPSMWVSEPVVLHVCGPCKATNDRIIEGAA